VTRYFVYTQWSGWLELTKEKFIFAERDAGFKARGGGPALATNGFSVGYMYGIVLEPDAVLPRRVPPYPAQAELEALIAQGSGMRVADMSDADIWRALGDGQ
jgi:hypothetical protein